MFMDVDTDGETVNDVVIYGGCRGQANALPRLVKGLSIDEVVKRIKGTRCRGGTSCADQLARILEYEKLKYGKNGESEEHKECEEDCVEK